MADITFLFKEGRVYELVDGQVVSSVKEADFGNEPQGGHPIQDEIEMPAPPPGIGQESSCPGCGSPVDPSNPFCPNCGSPLNSGGPEIAPAQQGGGPGYSGERLPEFTPYTGNTVTTPNGLKGRVLAHTPDLWGESVTIRFENGNIAKIPVAKELTFTAAENDPVSENPVEHFDERLAASVLSDRESLTKRAQELESIKLEARKLVSKASDAETASLDRISVEADYELREVSEALEDLAAKEGEGFEAPAPIENLPMVQQASTGGSKANWLDATLGEMITEASSLDYQKIMDEGPEAFVAGLDDAQLASAGTTRSMASIDIRNQTAGGDEEKRDAYEKVFLARVEEQRVARLSSRKEEVRKEASSEEPVNYPDESLFI